MLFTLLSCTSISNTQETGFVTEVTDGDTITIAGGARVRLLGINAPERGELGYAGPKNMLKQLILNKEVILESDGPDKDRYDRLLRHVFVNNTLITKLLAEQGLVHTKYYDSAQKYKKILAEAEAQAMKKQIGLWSESSMKNQAKEK